MSSTRLYKVLFAGRLTGEFDAETSRRQFGRLFKLAPARLETLFSGREYVIKNNVSEEVAMQFAIAIAEAGCETSVEPIEVSAVTELTFPDRRRGVRRLWIRRAPRAGAGQDRRQLPGRRSGDGADVQAATA